MPAAGRRSRLVLAASALALLAGCTSGERTDNQFRMVTESYNIRVIVDPAPPRALEPITWTVVVNDKETGEPINAGQGRVFASSRDGRNIANGFAPTEQVGMYRTSLMFVTAGSWAMGIQFRRDSTSVLERTLDWTQDVRSAEEPGEYSLPSSENREPPDPDSAAAANRDSAAPPDTAPGA